MKVVYNKVSNSIYTFVRDDATINYGDNKVVTVEDLTSSISFFDDSTVEGESNIESFITTDNLYLQDPKKYTISNGKVIPGKWLKIEDLRITRNKLLEDSDRLSFILWPDRWAGRTEGERADWLNYRKELRDGFKKYFDDITLNPEDHIWPELPIDEPVVVEVPVEASVDVPSDTPTGNTSPV